MVSAHGAYVLAPGRPDPFVDPLWSQTCIFDIGSQLRQALPGSGLFFCSCHVAPVALRRRERLGVLCLVLGLGVRREAERGCVGMRGGRDGFEVFFGTGAESPMHSQVK